MVPQLAWGAVDIVCILCVALCNIKFLKYGKATPLTPWSQEVSSQQHKSLNVKVSALPEMFSMEKVNTSSGCCGINAPTWAISSVSEEAHFYLFISGEEQDKFAEIKKPSLYRCS